jgi:hypothetical protein
MKKLTYLELLKEIKGTLGTKLIGYNGYYICSCAAYILNMSDFDDLESEYPEFYEWIMRIGRKYNKWYSWGSSWKINLSQVSETVLERKMRHLDEEIKRVENEQT